MAVTIDQIYSDTSAVISAMKTRVETAVGSLNNFISSWTYATIGNAAFQQTAFTYPQIGEADSAVADAFAAQDIAWRGAQPDIKWPADSTYPDFTEYFVSIPATGEKVAPLWTELDWVSLKDQLKAFTDNITSATALDAAVADLHKVPSEIQNALYQQDYQRKSQVLRDAYSAANGETGRKGFTFPNMMTTALQLAAQQTFQFEMSQVSRDLIKMLFDWAKTNYQFSAQQRVSAHGSDVDFNLKYQDTLLRAYDMQLKKTYDDYRIHLETELEKTAMLVKEYQTRVELVKTSASSVEAQDRNRIAQYAAEAKRAVDAFLAENQVAIENTKKALTGYTAIIEGAAKMAGAVSQISLGTVSTAAAATPVAPVG